VNADTVLPVVVLAMGTLVSGVVLGPDGSPLADVETEWRLAGTCDVAFTVRNSTDTDGRYEVALLPASYDVTLIPPPASGLAPEKLFSIAVAGPAAVVPTHQLSLVAPEIERCNQLDDDCDGMVDEAFPELGGACSAGVGACASAGVLVCAPDGTQSLCDAVPGSPTDEVCDGIDNDCNGVTDEGCSTVDVALHVTRPALSWGAVDGAIGYDVIRGDLDLLRGSGYATAVLECVADGTPMTTLDDPGAPPSERGWWFLVRVDTASGPESYGSAARDAGIDASPQACPP